MRDADDTWRQRAEAAIRCCESGHAPAYRRGRVAAQEDAIAELWRGIRIGERRGARTALVAVALLGIAAVALRDRR